MADRKISQLTDGGTVQPTDEVEVNRGGVSRRAVLPDIPENFLELPDTPSTFTGEKGKSAVVNDTEDGLIFKQISASVGVYTEPSYLDNLDGSVTIGTGTYILNSVDEGEELNKYDITGNTFVLVDNTTNYIVANYNGGSPVIQNTTNVNIIDESKVIPVRTIIRTGTVLHEISWDELGVLLANKVHASIVKTQRYRRQSGLTLSEFGTRNVQCSAGIIWLGANDITLSEVNSDVDNIRYYFHIAGVWNNASVQQYNNTQYDNGTDLVLLSNNRYAVNFIYRGVEEKKHLYMFLGSGDYTLAEAEAAQPPENIPSIVSSHAVLVGKIIVVRDGLTATTIQSAFQIPFNQSVVTEHNNLGALQGGAADEYYHLDNLDYQAVVNRWLYNNARTLKTIVDSESLTADRTLTVQDKSYTIADDAEVVKLTGNQSIDGEKTFIQPILLGDNQVVTTPVLGMLRRNDTSIEFYNGTAWVDLTTYIDENVKVSANDTTTGYLNDKLNVGDEFTEEIVNPSANESLLLKFKGWIYNTARTFKHILQSNATIDRTQQLQDKDGTIALHEDVTNGLSVNNANIELGGVLTKTNTYITSNRIRGVRIGDIGGQELGNFEVHSFNQNYILAGDSTVNHSVIQMTSNYLQLQYHQAAALINNITSDSEGIKLENYKTTGRISITSQNVGGLYINSLTDSMSIQDLRALPRGLGDADDYSENKQDNDYVTKKYVTDNTVDLTTNQSIDGEKTFLDPIILADNQIIAVPNVGMLRRNDTDIEFYDGTEWKSLTSGGGTALTAYQELAFNKVDPRILFNSNKTIYSITVVDQEITVQIDLTGAKNSFEAFGLFKGNGTNNLILSNFENLGTNTFDNTLDVVNAIAFIKMGEKYGYNILTQYTEDTTPPTLQSAVARKATPNTIELKYSELLDNTSTPATTDFVVRIDTVTQTVNTVTIVNDQVNVVISVDIQPGEVVDISYTAGVNPIQDLVGNDAANLVQQPVANQTQDILGIANLQGYWVAESATDFTLTGNNVDSWLDRSTNGRNLIASGGGARTFDSGAKAVVTGAVSGQYLNFSPLLNLGTEHTIVLYEEYTYKNATTTFNSEDAALDYIGEGSSNRFQMSSDAGIDFFDKGTLPTGIKKHVIRRNAGNLKWELNGVTLTHSTDVMTGNPTAQYRTEGLGFSNFLNLGNTHAWVLFTRELTDSEINNTVLPEIDGILGI